METICLQCGDRGFTNAFVYCVKCLDVAVHRYCLDIITFDKYVHWVCDDCEVEVQNQSSVQKHDAFPSQTSDKNELDESSGYFPLIQLAGMKDENKKRSIVESNQSYEECIKVGVIESARLASDSTLATKMKENEESEYRRYGGFSNDLVIISSAEPVLMPIWRGSFDIWNKELDILDGLMAHLSSKACQKVYDAACEFKPVLHLEMLPKSDVWPKSFDTSEPSGDSIALYFFPSKTSEQVFDELVEKMMGEELALKALMQNAELLIFTSTELPLLYWRFQGKHYLWGVFRGRQSPSPQSNSCQKELAKTNKVHVKTKRCGDGSPVSPLSNASIYGSGAF